MNEIEQSILAHIRGVAVASQVNVERNTGLLETGLLDSINLVGLIQFLEERFSIRIPDSDIGSDLFESPASLIAYVEKRLGATPSVQPVTG
jgi:acyl carrier protein